MKNDRRQRPFGIDPWAACHWILATSVFEMVGTKLGKLAKRVPDGETGERFHWISFQNAILGKTKGLVPGDFYSG